MKTSYKYCKPKCKLTINQPINLNSVTTNEVYTMGKTVKQIADEIGVSKTAIRKYMDKSFKDAYTTQEGERSPIIISDEGVAILKSKCKGANPENQFAETVETTANPEKKENLDVISLLKSELEMLNQQLATKDKQIEELTAANKNLTETNKSLTESIQAAQALNAADKKLLLEANSHRSIWSRIFKKKRQPDQSVNVE